MRQLIAIIDKASSVLLDNPSMFNYVRYLLAGKQSRMKHFIKAYLDKYQCKSVLDLCSGTGDFAGLTPPNASYVGWDLNKDFVNFAGKRYSGEKKKTFEVVDILTQNGRRHKKYDAVLLISAVHHFSDEELEIILPLVQKMVKKVVIIADIIPDPPHALQRFFASIDRGKFVRPAREKIRILKRHFKVINTEAIPTRSAVQLGIICRKK